MKKVISRVLLFIFISISTAFPLGSEYTYAKPVQKEVYVQSVKTPLKNKVIEKELIITASVPKAVQIPTPSPSPKPSIIATPTPVKINHVSLPVVMYHRIGDYYKPEDTSPANNGLKGLTVLPTEFEKQIKYFVDNGYKSATMQRILDLKARNAEPNRKEVILTFDDGYEDFYTNAFPVLKKYKFKATVYIMPNFIGRASYLSLAQIKEVQASGLVTIGSHTMNHAGLLYIDKVKAKYEITQSKISLEALLGTSVPDFCFPYGESNQAIYQMVKDAGYKTSVITSPRRWTIENDNFLIPRIRLSLYTSFELFKTMF